MPRVLESVPPATSLIAPFLAQPGHYADGFRVDIAGEVPLPRYIEAFYTSPLFKAERAVLRVAGQPSSDADAAALATDARDRFAAWSVEARRDTEILLADISGRTKSWLMAEACADGGTRLWFGSVIMATERAGRARIPTGFTILIGPHRAYSRALLSAAARRLAVRNRPVSASR